MKTFLFDIDGTILDSVTAYIKGLQETLATFDQHYSPDELAFSNGLPAMETFRRLAIPEANRQLAFDRWNEKTQPYMDQAHLFPGMAETLDTLHQTHQVGIVTSKAPDQFHTDDHQFHFTDYTDTVVMAGDAPRNKPYGDPIQLAMTRLHAQPETTVYIGDTPADAHAAHDAGVAFALATWTTPPDEALEPIAFLLKRPADILALV